MKTNPHKSFSSLNAKRARAEAAVLSKARQYYAKADRLERQGKPMQARVAAIKGKDLVKRAYKAGAHTDGPIGRLPNPKKKTEAYRGTQQAYKGFLIKQSLDGRFYISYQGHHYGSATTQKEAEKMIDDLQWVRNPARDKNSTSTGLKAELFQVDRDIAELETDPFYRETAGRKAYARKWLAYHRRQRREIERLLRRQKNGLVDIAAGMQALDYLGGKVRGKKRNPTPNDYRRIAQHAMTEHLKALQKHGRGSAEEKAAGEIWRAASRKAARVTKPENTKKLRRMRRSHNPSVTALSETFQGQADGTIDELWASDYAPKNIARAGKLVFLKVGNRSLRLPGAMVGIAPNGKLWITGNQSLFQTKAKPGEGLDMGEVSQICYETAKQHIGDGKTFEYVHEFGEDGGKRPHLIIDHEGMPILRGGDYQIKAEGIVN